MSTSDRHTAADVFVACARAMQSAILIQRVSRSDKEFHFQNWVAARIADSQLDFDPAGRNGYPDFTLVQFPDGYETKGLQWPGREASTDGTTGQATLITPDDLSTDIRLEKVGEIVRIETSQVVVGYSFDLVENTLTPSLAPNPSAGAKHQFGAYRLKGVGSGSVAIKHTTHVQAELADADEE